MYTSSLKIECAAKGGEGLEKGRECENYLLSKKRLHNPESRSVHI